MEENKFEVISSKVSNANFKNHSSFGKSIFLPFISGVLGCSIVIGTCFGVPSIKNKIFGNSSTSTVQTSTSTSN